MYTEKVMELFRNPRFIGEIKGCSGKGMVGNKQCGDVMEVFIKVGKRKERKKETGEETGKEEEVIEDIKFRTFGCVAAIASSEALCSIVKGKTIDEALKVTKKDIIDFMGGEIPPVKIHCSVLASEALKKAIEDYKKGKA